MIEGGLAGMEGKPGQYELWYRRRDNVVRDPFLSNWVSDLLPRGRLSGEDEVSTDGKAWVRITKIVRRVAASLVDSDLRHTNRCGANIDGARSDSAQL
ncbi:MAG: hypothetical protein JSW09_01815 [Pseudomonadota bacterium]|nr:MAG: hypothetical protein JSW09_01815 [Pseudomonadota bacterium]